MPTLEQNREVWEKRHPWPKGGDEWSSSWGTSDLEWSISIQSRLIGLLPADHIVEIAPGFGRWTQYLLPACKSYIGVDLAQKCVEACQKRFADVPHARFYQGDGTTLAMVENSSVDFLISFDSLVHADWAVIDSYIREFARVLKPGAKAFIHHSNLGEFVGPGLPKVEKPRWRGDDVSAERFRKAVGAVGLACLSQEIVAWFVPELIDCISVIEKPRPGAPGRETIIIRNANFPAEGEIGRRIAATYYRVTQPESTEQSASS
jgi:SAM-dependent methyltransferase